jgi:uncharacterized protein (DUF1015 family)
MAEIAPFRGIRYDQSVVGDLEKVTSPPYDVISPEDRTYYHRLHPNNFVRLILGEEFESDSESENRFTRAGAYLDEWLKAGILKQDREPAIYVYRQQFEENGRWKSVRGLLPAVRLHDYRDRVVLPHETTLAKPKSQLLELARHTHASLDSIYGLYADEDGELDGVIDRAMAGPALGESTDKNGVRHALWAITDPADIEQITGFFLDKMIAIADGHHRYETALTFRDEMRKSAGTQQELPSDWALMTLVNVHQPDITVYPTHRAVGSLQGPLLEGLEKALEADFVIEPSSKEQLIADMASRGAIGMYRPGEAETLKLKSGAEQKLVGSEASRRLELNILHDLILDRALGIDEENLRNETNIVYARKSAEAMEMVDRGERQIAFLLNHIPVKTVLDVAIAGERMPQKATYFYPKLLSGLVLRKMEL